MITDHRLFALEDAGSIEKYPIEDVLADLEALGFDPSLSIYAARGLAAKRSSPATRLLARLDDADDLDADLVALETASIEDLQEKVPQGQVGAVAASAMRPAVSSSAGVLSKVTSFPWGGRRARRVGGSMVGLAACLLLFFIVRPDQHHDVEQLSADAPNHAAVTTHSTENAEQAAGPPNRTLDLSDQAETMKELAKAQPQRAAEAKDALARAASQASRRALATDQVGKNTASRQEADKLMAAPSPAGPDVMSTERSATSTLPAPPAAMPSPARALGDAGASPKEGWVWDGEAEAILIVDWTFAPMDLVRLVALLPQGNLTDRLNEARVLARDRQLVALIRARQDDEAVDKVLVLRGDAGLDREEAVHEDEARSPDPGYEIIDLP